MNPRYLASLFTLSIFILVVSCTKPDGNSDPNPPTTPPTNPPTSNPPTPAPIDSAAVIYSTTWDSVYAFDASNGRKKWSLRIEELQYQPASYGEGMLFFPLDNKKLIAVDTSGKIKWTKTLDKTGTNRHVVVSKGLAYINDSDGNIYAFEVLTGNLKWRVKGLYQNENLVLKDGLIYQGGPIALDIFDASTGQLKMTISTGSGHPVLYGNKIYAYGAGPGNGDYLKVYDKETGAFIKQLNVSGDLGINAGHGQIYLLAGGISPDNIVAIDTATLSLQWRTENFATGIQDFGLPGAYPIVVDSFIAVEGASSTKLYDVKTGKLSSQREIGGSKCIFVNDLVYVSSRLNTFSPRHKIVAAERSTVKVLWASIELNGEESGDLCVVTKSGKMYRNGMNYY